MSAERAAIVTGASSGIGLAIARVLGEEGFGVTMAARRPEKLEAAVAGLPPRASTCTAVAANVSEERRSRRSSPPTASATAGWTCSSTTPASASARPSGRSRPSASTCSSTINLRSIVLFYRECVPTASGRRGRAQERARRQHLLDLRQVRPGLAVGLLRDQARRRRLDRSDEQGTRAAGHQVDARCAPRSWTRR